MSGLLVWSRILVGVVAFGVIARNEALACNTVGVAHLGSANADRVVVRFQARRPALEIEEQWRIAALAGYFTDLGGAWRSTVVTPSTLKGDIHFYRTGKAIDSFWISPTTLGRGGCYRDLSSQEFSALVSILDVKPSDFEK